MNTYDEPPRFRDTELDLVVPTELRAAQAANADPIVVHTAPTLRRTAAALIDLVVPLSLWVLGTWLLVTTDPDPPPVAPWNVIDQVVDYLHDRPGRVLASVGLFVALQILWPLIFGGRTPGRSVMQLGFSAGDRPVSLARLFGWGCARVVLVLPAGFGALWAIIDPDRRTLYDRLAGLWVVHNRRPDDEIRR